jgi:hypothetical protein
MLDPLPVHVIYAYSNPQIAEELDNGLYCSFFLALFNLHQIYNAVACGVQVWFFSFPYVVERTEKGKEHRGGGRWVGQSGLTQKR